MGQALMEGAGVFTPSASLLVDLYSFNFLAGAGAIKTSSSDIKIGMLSSIEANFPRKMVVLGIAHTGLPSFIQCPELEGLEKMLICPFCCKIDKAESSASTIQL